MAKYTANMKLAPGPQHLKQEKGKSKEKKGKRGSSQLVKIKEKEHFPHFPFPGRSPPCRGYWYSPTGNFLGNPTFVDLNDRQGMLARPGGGGGNDFHMKGAGMLVGNFELNL